MLAITARKNRREALRTAADLAALALVVFFLALSLQYLQGAVARDQRTVPLAGPAMIEGGGQAPAAVAVETEPASLVEPAAPAAAPVEQAPAAFTVLGPGGHIYIPAIGLDQPLNIMANVDDQAPLDAGPSWLSQTSWPGLPGNCVLAGHRSTFTQPFHDLDQLAAGDTVVLTDDAGSSFTYVVDRIFTVNPNQVEVMKPTPNATFTMITCHPIGSSRQRLIVQGHLE